MGNETQPASVHVTVADDHIHVRLGGHFTVADLAIVKRIPGRRWLRDTRYWWLPSSQGALASLRDGFGKRLVLEEEGQAEAGPAVRGPDPQPHGGPPVPSGATTTGSVGGPRSAGLPPAGVPAAPALTGRAAAQAAVHAAAGLSGVPNVHGAMLPTEELLAALRRVVRLREYSTKTEKAYVAWVKRYLRWAGTAAGPATSSGLDEQEMVAFLEHLGADGLAARSRNQAASALNFLRREVLLREDPALPRAKGPARMPLVLTHREVMRLLAELKGKYLLVGMLLYSSGLRIGECLILRIKDMDFELRQILVRDGKGKKDRYVPLAVRALDPLRAQIRQVLEQHRQDRAAGHGWAPLPGALHRKTPGAGFEPGWQFLFPASTINTDPATGRTGRWSLHVTAAERAVKEALRRSGIMKRATCHTLRHSFATETLRGGCDIRTLQHVMGHRDIRTTTIYLHAVKQTGLYIRSPLDRPDDYQGAGSEIIPALLAEDYYSQETDRHFHETGRAHRHTGPDDSRLGGSPGARP
jgi:integron integrase